MNNKKQFEVYFNQKHVVTLAETKDHDIFTIDNLNEGQKWTS